MQVASYAIRDGYTERLLYDYVDKGLSGKTITISGDMVVAEEDEGQLTLDGTNCVAIWSSSDENVLTVDNNGKVKGLRAGTATVTAKMGNVTVQCIVTVKRGWTKPY